MDGRRQQWTQLSLCALSICLWAVAAGLVEPVGSWPAAATLVATSLLLALGAVRLTALGSLARQCVPVARTRPVPVPRLIRLCDPDAAGRPRPRAPGCAPAARTRV